VRGIGPFGMLSGSSTAARSAQQVPRPKRCVDLLELFVLFAAAFHNHLLDAIQALFVIRNDTPHTDPLLSPAAQSHQ
jgi:hypothetical protein